MEFVGKNFTKLSSARGQRSMYSLCKGHYFADCNKRISITLTANFFLKNGYMYLLKNFMSEMEAIGYHVAAGHIDRDLLTKVMRCIVNDEDYSESIKLELIEAPRQAIRSPDADHSETRISLTNN